MNCDLDTGKNNLIKRKKERKNKKNSENDEKNIYIINDKKKKSK